MKRYIAVFLLLMMCFTPSRAYAAGDEVPNDTELTMESDDLDVDAEAFLSTETVAGGAIDVSSPCAILIEKETGEVLYEKNADEKREPASVTKVMTELLIVEALDSGRIALDDMVTTSQYASSMGGSQVFLKEGEQLTVRDMLKAIVISSANDAAVAMAEHLAGSEQAFAAQMNARANDLGMTNSHFTNASGLLDNTEHYTTARDIALMSRELIRHDAIKEFTTIWTDSLRDGAFGLANTNQLVRYFNGATGLKTGFTSRAGYCLSATAMRDGVEYISVTLGDATSKARFESARALLTYAFAHYTLINSGPDEVLQPIPVELGKQGFVQPEPAVTGRILIPREIANSVVRYVDVAPSLMAPVQEGDVVGRVLITAGDRTIGEVQLLATQSSERLNIFEIFARMFGMLFTTPIDS
ncbi:MAG: D-alanyl-D-alanine carboxypeptidase [Oscillospiraceae bacterium]|jgi:D-alanyl-D-alanine carboxypeptidase (penicillin-binding protein 5/6)|nr:D-alanyl-D-alanine carboxypeptidase [Oscillospiraceae bacterium]